MAIDGKKTMSREKEGESSTVKDCMKEKFDRQQQIQNNYWSQDKQLRRTPDHQVVQAAFNPLADLVASSIDNPNDSSVLDIGCGNGFLQWALEKRFRSVAGLDYSEQMLAVNPCKEKHLCSCTNLPFADKSFDVAVAAHLLHHLTKPDRIQAITEMKRVARLTVISFEPNRNNPLMFAFSLFKREERMALRFSSNYMLRLFIEAGFVNVNAHVKGWIVPNKTPAWWVPIGNVLGRTPLGRLGVDICTVGQVTPRNDLNGKVGEKDTLPE